MSAIGFQGYLESDGEIAYKRVSGAYQWRTGQGLSSWDGHLEIESGEIPRLGTYNLHFDSGKVGKIIITRISQSSGNAPTLIMFQGSGPIQEAED